MNASLERSKWLVKHTGSASRYLLAVTIILMVTLAGLFFHISTQQDEMQASIREDALWAVYQVDREAMRLIDSFDAGVAADGSRAASDEGMALRYDILHSRLGVLLKSSYGEYFEDNPVIRQMRQRAGSLIVSLEPVVAAIAAGKALDRQAAGQVKAKLEDLRKTTGTLLVRTNAAVSASRAEAREEMMRLQGFAGVLASVLLIVVGLLIVNLIRQLRLVRSAGEHIETIASEMQEAFRAAEAGNRAKSEFMATMGHEIRTPLNAILGMAELLHEADLNEEQAQSVQVIRSSGETLLESINEILDFAKMEHGKQEFERIAFRLEDFVNDVPKVMEGRAREQNDTITIDFGADMDGKVYVSDPYKLRRVLLNLVSNAVKFTRNGQVLIRIRDVSQDGVCRLRFEVADSGIGIPEEARRKLFQPFQQVDGSIGRRYGGTGLGLAICKGIVEGLGGEIGLDSVPGQGSTFWFEVPVGLSASDHAMPQRPATGDTPLPALSILLVEDNKVNQAVACRFLEKLGQHVDIAEDGEAGVRMADERRYDIILMDMQMPGMDGVTATMEIRKASRFNARTWIVAMTANASDQDRERCFKAGMNAFATKPVSFGRLRSVLAEAPLSQDREMSKPAVPVTNMKGDAMPGVVNVEAVDTAIVDELIDAIGNDGYQDLVGDFVEDCGIILRDIEAAMGSGDRETADRALHTLKGAASTLGFTGLAQFAQEQRKSGLETNTIQQIAGRVDALRIAIQAQR
ncbi:MAG: hybrid sensor histidine kinase/response regulator [Phyllobacteriaceae bacterium]|nr:hybrid sensor histidine kinase/response regulator [Phyllobacteriaceae bacterium]